MVGIVMTLVGYALYIRLVAEAYMCVRTTYWPSVRFQEIRFQMDKYMSFKRLSNSIQKRILALYDFSFNGKFIRKPEIDEWLGNDFRHLVKMQTCQQLLKRKYFFKQIPEELLSAMSEYMTEMIFLCNDLICKVEATRAQACFDRTIKFYGKLLIWIFEQKLFLIVSGTVAVYTEDGEETAHLIDGNMFGETAFLHYDESSVGSYVPTWTMFDE